MNKIIFDVPAASGGALSILNLYYNKALEDKKNKYIFVVSTPELENQDNIKIIKYPWIKYSWIHRLFFDYLIAPRIVKKNNVKEIISLQNVRIPRVKVSQTIYLHQPLPFIQKKYSFFENKKYWIYQNIVGRLIKKSLKKADKIIVQSSWLKNILLHEKIILDATKIEVEIPKLNILDLKPFINTKENYKRFFFPSSDEVYKNHKIIVNACIEVLKENRVDFEVYFTLKLNQLDETLQNIITENNLPIVFLGNLSQKEVYKYYENSILIFPSKIETFGLPLLEAKKSDGVILSIDEVYSKEVLGDYQNAYFFKDDDYKTLASLMINQLENGYEIYNGGLK